MSSIFAIISKKVSLDLSIIVEDAMSAMSTNSFGRTEVLYDEHVGFGCNLIEITPESKNEILPFNDEKSKCWLTSDSRIDYREDLLEELEIGISSGLSLPDSYLILNSYLKWGEKCVNHLHGDFAFVIWDERKKFLFCARDHFGCRPLFYINQPEYLALTSDLKAFKAIPGFEWQIDDQFILDSVCAIIPKKDTSAYFGIERLKPAHYLTYNTSDALLVSPYWDLIVNADFTILTEAKAINEFRRKFYDAIRQRVRTQSPIGIELSGGLDSSGIASCLTKILDSDKSVYAFSHAFPENQTNLPYAYNNELIYSSRIVNTYNLKKHFIITGKNNPGSYMTILSTLENTLKPVCQSFALMSDLLHEEAQRSGIKILLSGFGGDEGVTYQGAGIYEELAIERNYKKLKNELKIKSQKKGVDYLFLLIKLHIRLIAPKLVRLIKKDWRHQRFKKFALNIELSNMLKMKKRYLKNVGLPTSPNVRERQYRRLMHSHISDRLENSYAAAQLNGFEYSYPFLDVKLVEFVYSLSSNLKFANGMGRYIFRKSMEDIIPDEIRLRVDKTGAAVPNVSYRLLKDEGMYRNIITESRHANKYHYVDYDKLSWMIDQFKQESLHRNIKLIPREFLSSFSILILQKWQREGKIDIGIKC